MSRYAVIGNPIQHSLSPRIHQLFAAQTRRTLIYDAQLVARASQLADALDMFQTAGGQGLNVTAPYKELVYSLMHEVSPAALQARAVNTVTFGSDGYRFGHNTDGVGLVTDLTQNQRVSLKGARILLLGAGGAARGVLAALLALEPAALVICNRTLAKATTLIAAIASPAVVRVLPWGCVADCPFDIVINSTSAGVEKEDFILPSMLLAANAYCYDMAYGIGETHFARWAQQNGARYSDGLGMLVEQAAESFYSWHHVKPDTCSVLAQLRG